MFKQMFASVSTLVVLFSSVGAALATSKGTTLQPNTITPAQVEAIVKRAYETNPEARLCMRYYGQQMYETALGYCYSWSYQALDAEEIAVARETVNTAAFMIRLGIHHERQ